MRLVPVTDWKDGRLTILDPSFCEVRDPTVDVGFAEGTSFAVSPPVIRVAEGSSANSDAPLSVDKDEVKLVGLNAVLLRDTRGGSGREADGDSDRETDSGGRSELETTIAEGDVAEADTSLLGVAADPKLEFGVSKRKPVEVNTSLSVSMADPELEFGISERKSVEAVDGLRVEVNAGSVTLDASTPDADPLVSEGPFESERVFCGVLGRGGKSVTLVNRPDVSPDPGA